MGLEVTEGGGGEHKPSGLPIVHHMPLLLHFPFLEKLRHDVHVDLLYYVHLEKAHKLLCQLTEQGQEVDLGLSTEPFLDVLLLLIVTIGSENEDHQVHNVINMHLQFTL